MVRTSVRSGPLARAATLVGLAAVGLAVSAGPALAAPIVVTGDTTGGPTYNRTLFDCATPSGFATDVPYEATDIAVDTDGSYEVRTTTGTYDGVLFVYLAPFDPTEPADRCLAANDDATEGDVDNSAVVLDLLASQSYVVVQTGFSNEDFGPYGLRVAEAGDVGPTPVVPEVPVAVLLPLAAAGIGAVALRRRVTA